jgi:hypothetical protein
MHVDRCTYYIRLLYTGALERTQNHLRHQYSRHTYILLPAHGRSSAADKSRHPTDRQISPVYNNSRRRLDIRQRYHTQLVPSQWINASHAKLGAMAISRTTTTQTPHKTERRRILRR